MKGSGPGGRRASTFAFTTFNIRPIINPTEFIWLFSGSPYPTRSLSRPEGGCGGAVVGRLGALSELQRAVPFPAGSIAEILRW